MDFLYVCLFSNAHMKVGRSYDPVSRVAQHAERVACMGVELVATQNFCCVDQPERREAELIGLCGGYPGAQRFKSEWFSGLDYETVCGWAHQMARREVEEFAAEIHPLRAVRQKLELSQAELAVALDCTQGNISFIERGVQTLTPDLAKTLIRFARDRGVSVTYEDLYGVA